MNIVPFSFELAQNLYTAADEFPVDFDNCWIWLGYSTKQKAENQLFRHFSEGIDFLTIGLKSSSGGRPSKQINISVNCFKELGMMAGTEKGKEVRGYFLECERRLKQVAQSNNPSEIAFSQLADFCQKQLALMGLKPELQRIYLLRAMEAQYTEQSPAFNTLLTAAKENCTVPDHHITPTKLGELYAQRHHLDKPVLPADINRALEAAGLQRKEVEVRSNGKKRNVWHLTERGEEYGILILDRASRVDKTVQVVRWLPSVLAEINVHTFTNS